MLGTEAIWWLNSVLLAALTHAGLLWVLVLEEPEEPQKPPETAFSVVSLPNPQDAVSLPVEAKAKTVKERSQPLKVSNSETAEKLETQDAEQASKVQQSDSAVKANEALEDLKSAVVTTKAEPVESDVSVQQSNLESEKAEPAVASESVSRPTSQSSLSAIESDVTAVQEADRTDSKVAALTPEASEGPAEPAMEKAEETKLSEKAQAVEERAVAETKVTPEAPEAAAPRATISQPVKDVETAQRPRPRDQTKQLKAEKPEQVAILSPGQETGNAVQNTPEVTPARKVPVKEADQNTRIKPKKKFAFPKNAQRLTSTSTKAAKKVEPERVGRVRGNETGDSAAATVETGRSDQAEQVAIASSKKAGRVEPDSRFNDLLRFLEGNEITGCATVLPTIAADGSVSLSGFAANEGMWATFQQSMDEKLRLRLPLTAATVARPQCRALTFARTLPGYPRFSLGMKLDNTELVSGDFLRGTITDIRGRHLHVLVVDDEGLVQQIDDYVQPRIGGADIKVALSVSGQAVRTAQMLIAVATKGPLETVATANATQADEFFSILSEELAVANRSADIAIVSFYLRSN